MEGCHECIVPSMWRAHMTLHVQAIHPGEVQNTWLEYTCLSSLSPARYWFATSQGGVLVQLQPLSRTQFLKCHPTLMEIPALTNAGPSLPIFEEVCLLNQPTLRFMSSKSRPAFGRALSSARGVSSKRTEESWPKSFMLSFLHLKE